jgi:hypothetical protein
MSPRPSKLTRRKAIAAALAAPALAGPARLTPDPVFAAIAAHKAAYARLDQACLHVSRLEETILEASAARMNAATCGTAAPHIAALMRATTG